MAQLVKNPPAKQETHVRSLSQEYPLEKEMALPAVQKTPVEFLGHEDVLEKGKATHSSILGLLLWLSW